MPDGKQGEAFFYLYFKNAGGGKGQLFNFFGLIIEANLNSDRAGSASGWALFYCFGQQLVQVGNRFFAHE